MRLFPKIPPGRALWAWPPVILAFAVATGFLATGAARIAVRERALAREQRALEERVRTLEVGRSRLEAAIAALDSPEAVERAAKERLDLKQSGEEVVVVVPDEAADAPEPPGGAWVGRILGPWLWALLRVFQR